MLARAHQMSDLEQVYYDTNSINMKPFSVPRETISQKRENTLNFSQHLLIAKKEVNMQFYRFNVVTIRIKLMILYNYSVHKDYYIRDEKPLSVFLLLFVLKNNKKRRFPQHARYVVFIVMENFRDSYMY